VDADVYGVVYENIASREKILGTESLKGNFEIFGEVAVAYEAQSRT
jgi:hypothetical protein